MSERHQTWSIVCICLVAALAIAFAAYREGAIRRELASIAKEREDFSAQVSALSGERDAAKARAQELAAEPDKLRQELDAAKKALEASKSEGALAPKLEALGKDLGSASQSAEKLLALAAQTGEKIAALESGLGALAKAADLKAAADQTIAKLGEERSLLEKNAGALEALAKALGDVREEIAARERTSKSESAEWRAELASQKLAVEEVRAELARSRAVLEDVLAACAEIARAEKSPGDAAAPLPPDAAVQAQAGAALVVKAGENHGVAPGDVLYVTRGGKPVASIQAVNVYPNSTGARILEVVKGESVRPGDSVSRAMPLGWRAFEREPYPAETAPSVPPAPPAVPPPPPPPPAEKP